MPNLITLQDKAANPATVVRLMVDEDADEGGAATSRWAEGRVPRLPPRITQAAFDWSQRDPTVDFLWVMDDWSEGGMRPYYRSGDKRYADAVGMDARWEGVFALGMEKSTLLDFLIRNPHAEKATLVWTNGGTAGATLSRDSASPHGGSNSWRVEDDPASETVWVEQSLANPTVYQSREITVGGYIRLDADGGSGMTPRIEIYDGVGTSSSSTVSASSDTYVSVTRTIDAAATEVTIRVGNSSQTLTGTGLDYHFDDLFVLPTGSSKCAGTAEHSSLLYGAFGRTVAQWSENDRVWQAVYIHASANTTDIIHFANNVLVAFGTGQSYIYGSGTTWTVSTETTPDDKAGFWASAQDNAGATSLWKSESDNTIARTTDPTNGGVAWSAVYTIGSSDREIVRMYGAFNTVVVAKEDGLWKYDDRYPGSGDSKNAFVNITQEADIAVSLENFAIGADWHGWLWFAAAQQSFLRWQPPVRFQDLSSLLTTPRLTDFGGRVLAVSAAPHELWLLLDTPTDSAGVPFPITFPGVFTAADKVTRLISLREVQGKLITHPLDTVNVPSPDNLTVFKSTGDNHVYALGRLPHEDESKDTVQGFRWTLPETTPAPYSDLATQLGTSGHFDTSIWHGNDPDTPKAFLALTIWGADFDAQHTVKVEFGLDGAVPTTTTLTTFTGSGAVQTAFFNSLTAPTTEAVGRTIQFRITTATDDNVSPKIYAIALHSTLRSARLRTWEIFVRVGNEEVNDSGYFEPTSKSELLADLDTLEDQTYPIVFERSFDEPLGTTLVTTTVHLVHREREPDVADEDRGYEIHRLLLQEADTS